MSPYHRFLLSVTCLVLAATAGCAGNLTNLFSDEFLNQLGLRQRAASVPGAAPAIVVFVENRTNRTIDAVVSMRLGGDDVDSRCAPAPGSERYLRPVR